MIKFKREKCKEKQPFVGGFFGGRYTGVAEGYTVAAARYTNTTANFWLNYLELRPT